MTTIYIIAGEASGDFLGARLIAALRERRPGIEIRGIGGALMTGQGMTSLFPMTDLSVMGIAEVAPKLPLLLRRIRETAIDIGEHAPDAIVTIDAPDFCFRVAREVRRRGYAGRIIHHVAPTVWAWREGRAKKIASFLDGLICLFDFEPPYFECYGLRAVAVGHPLVEGRAMLADGAAYRVRHGIAPEENTLGLLFGSRSGELARTGPAIRDAAYRCVERVDRLIVQTLPHLEGSVREMLSGSPRPVVVTSAEGEKYDAFKAMDAAIAVSGTVGLELAALQVPHVIAYRANPLTAAIARRMIKVRYAHLANIMADREIVPEFLQERCDPAMIAEAAERLLANPSEQIAGMADIAERLGAGQERTPSQKAADFVLSFTKST